MGITALSVARLERNNCLQNGIKMCELGGQNIYTPDGNYGKIAKHYFESFGVQHRSFDILVHNEAEYIDLRKKITYDLIGVFDVVTDFGTSEHCEGNYYQVCKNIHDLCATNGKGLIIRENPKTGNWFGHGYNYLDEQFYIDLAYHNNYEILELGTEPAMGNDIDGNNIAVVLRKPFYAEFMPEKKFNELIKYYTK